MIIIYALTKETRKDLPQLFEMQFSFHIVHGISLTKREKTNISLEVWDTRCLMFSRVMQRVACERV